MNRHASTEQISAYLDAELGFAEIRQLETHFSACTECGTRLDSMRRVVSGLGRVERAVPPAALRQQIRRQIVAEPPAPAFRRALTSFRLLLFPVRPALRAAVGMGFALVIGLITLNQQVGTVLPPPGHPGQEVVTVEPGAQFSSVLTTSEVAGREFIWTEDGWIQKGLEGQTPVARVDAGSPQGRALLTKYSDLQFLLEDGSPVVLRYNLETVEIRHAAPVRVIGFETQPSRVAHHTHGRTVAA
jgi:hypothetical protein